MIKLPQTFAPRKPRKQELELRLTPAQLQQLDAWINSDEYTYEQISDLTRKHFPYHVKHSAVGIRANKLREAKYLSKVSNVHIDTENYLRVIRNEPSQLDQQGMNALMAAAAAILDNPCQKHTPASLLTLQRIFNQPFQDEMYRKSSERKAELAKLRLEMEKFRAEHSFNGVSSPAHPPQASGSAPLPQPANSTGA